MALSAEDRATQSADAMWANDRASPFLGLTRVSVTPGRAVFSLTVAEHHLNGLDICHGGFIFTLADTTFAFACNSYNASTVAQHAAIDFLAPGRLGDVLTATAMERQTVGRSGIYDITVTNQDAVVIAEFRGLSRRVKGQLFEEPTDG